MSVALMLDPGEGGVDPQVTSDLKRAAVILEDAGYRIEEQEPPRFTEAAALWAQLNVSSPPPAGFAAAISEDAKRVLDLWGEAETLEPTL